MHCDMPLAPFILIVSGSTWEEIVPAVTEVYFMEELKTSAVIAELQPAAIASVSGRANFQHFVSPQALPVQHPKQVLCCTYFTLNLDFRTKF